MVARLTEAFAAVDVEAEVQVIEPDQLATTIGSVWAVKRPDAVVVAGGDGTINGAANAIMGTDVCSGVLVARARSTTSPRTSVCRTISTVP